MRINSHILSIPPYISTSWENIASLHVENEEPSLMLIVTLLNGTSIEVPELERSILDAIFTAHAKFLEQEQAPMQNKFPPAPIASSLLPTEHVMAFEIPIKSNLEMDQFGSMLQHNPDQADGPELPYDLICKIAHLSKSIGIDDPDVLPQPEPHCNCMHCQIARAMHSGMITEQNHAQLPAAEEEVVTDEELTFRSWDIEQTGDRLFSVSNPLDTKEQYSVFLGTPVGCTCGEKHCEHIQAVLKS